jgi:hypothetical protein
MPTFCVPTLSSLPGSPASDFDWWSAAPDPTLLRYYPDNPNWLGAFSLSQGNGANRDVLFRVLKGVLGGTNYLLLQWIARTSANDINIDRANVLLGVPGGNYVAFAAKLADATPNVVAGTQNAGTFVYRVRGGSAAGGTVTLSGAEDSAGADIENTGRMWVTVTSPTRLIQAQWAFQVAIPLGANWGAPALANQLNLPAAGAFKLWFEVLTSLGPGMAATPQQWPTTAPTTTSDFQIIPSGGIAEADMLDLSTAGAGCTDAVKLVSTQVGTRAVPGGAARPNTHTIKLDLGKPYPPVSAPYDESYIPDVTNVEHQNQFFAVPTFPAGMAVAQKEAVRATFSLANWGSQYSTPTPASWRPVPGGTDTPFQNANGDCRFSWPTAGEPTAAGSFVTTLVRNINKYLNALAAGVAFPAGSQNPHQCMLVELSSVDPAVVITTSSVFANMNVANASTFRRFAEISVVGAPPISTRPRDVYLYVQKFNMPAVAPKEGQPPPPPVNNFNLDRVGFAASTGGPRGNDVEDLAAFVPTYTVHGYMDTGRTYELKDGRKIPVLQPQTAFGYFVLHEGDLHGWETRLYGAEKLAENLYIVRVPNNGSVHVETAIQARERAQETPLPPDGKPEVHRKPGCLALLLGLFGHKKH